MQMVCSVLLPQTEGANTEREEEESLAVAGQNKVVKRDFEQPGCRGAADGRSESRTAS